VAAASAATLPPSSLPNPRRFARSGRSARTFVAVRDEPRMATRMEPRLEPRLERRMDAHVAPAIARPHLRPEPSQAPARVLVRPSGYNRSAASGSRVHS
jgi:hypothetical protein